MFARITRNTLVAMILIGAGSATNSASAVTLEVANKCNALTAQAFPPAVPGNPAAGREGGNGHSVRKLFNRCVANGGHIYKHHKVNPSGKH